MPALRPATPPLNQPRPAPRSLGEAGRLPDLAADSTIAHARSLKKKGGGFARGGKSQRDQRPAEPEEGPDRRGACPNTPSGIVTVSPGSSALSLPCGSTASPCPQWPPRPDQAPAAVANSDLVTCIALLIPWCAPPAEPQPEQTVRLLGDGANPFRGRLEVFVKGAWGTVSTESLTAGAVEVLCRQLGYTPELTDRTCAPKFFVWDQNNTVDASVPVYLDDLQCVGGEAQFEDCKYKWKSKYSHLTDAGLQCCDWAGELSRALLAAAL